MPKLNKGHPSFFLYLASKIKLVKKLYLTLYPKLERETQFPITGNKGRILSGFQPFQDMGKDIIDSFLPYKGGYQVTRDIAQPILGLINIAKGIGNVISVPIVFLINTVRYIFISGSFENFKKNMEVNSARSAGWLIDAVSSIIRGVLQIITTPLVWFLKIPLRGILTLFMGKPYAEHSAGIKRLLKEKDKNQGLNNQQIENKLVHITEEIRSKYEKGIDNGQSSKIDPEEVRRLELCSTDTVSATTFLNFFSKAQEKNSNNDMSSIRNNNI